MTRKFFLNLKLNYLIKKCEYLHKKWLKAVTLIYIDKYKAESEK